jgi:hypothetical protein
MRANRDGNGIRRWIAGSLLLAVLYVLGVGPAFWLIEKQWLPKPVARVIVYAYWPTGMVYDGTTRPRAVLHWYLAQWMTTPPPP